MNGNDKKILSFQKAQQAILATIHRLPNETVALSEALQRITATDVLALIPQPTFD